MQSNDIVGELAFILLIALLTAIAMAVLTLFLTWIVSKVSYRKRMRPLNEAEKKQREEEKERRKKLLSS